MTRRGSLAYYLAAVVVGCFFTAAGVAGIGEASLRLSRAGLRDLFLLYFLALAYGWFTLLVFAFVLRRCAGAGKSQRGWAWAAWGALLSPALVWTLYGVWHVVLAPRVPGGPQLIWWMIFGAAIGIAEFASSRLAATVCAGAIGAATALVLYRVQRAFVPPQG